MAAKVYEVEEFLLRPMKLEEEIRGDMEHIAALQGILNGNIGSLSFTGRRSPPEDSEPVKRLKADIAAENEKLGEKTNTLMGLKLETENFIREIPDYQQQKMLRRRFIRGESIMDIGRDMGLSKTGTYRLYDRAMKAAALLMRNEPRFSIDRSGILR